MVSIQQLLYAKHKLCISTFIFLQQCYKCLLGIFSFVNAFTYFDSNCISIEEKKTKQIKPEIICYILSVDVNTI